MEKQALAVREQQWYQTITTAKQSGQSIKSWCAENGVPLSSFYSWQRKMRSALLRQESVQFEELSPSSPKTAAIPPTQITLHIRTRLMKPCLHLLSPKCENSTMEKMYF